MGAQCCAEKASTSHQLMEIIPQPEEPKPAQTPPEAVQEPVIAEQPTEEVAEAQKEETQGIPMVFEADGMSNTVYATRKPLGMVFEIDLPITIKGFKTNSHGEAIGVKVGWVLKSCNGEDCANLSKVADAMDIIMKHIQPLPVQEPLPGLPMVCVDESGVENTVYVTRKPLGMQFGETLPIKITNFRDNSHGQEVGMKIGWVLKSFNGDDFTRLSTFKEAMQILQKHTERLPTQMDLVEEKEEKASK